MGFEFIYHVIKITIAFAASLLALTGYFYGLDFGMGILAGASWGSLNLFLIKNLLQSLLISPSNNFFAILVFLGIKFPFLYALGYGLLKINLFPILSLVLGFSLIFLVIFLIGIVRLLTLKEGPEAK